MTATGTTIETSRKAKVTPTARASMLVAMARSVRRRRSRRFAVARSDGPSFIDSKIIFPPMRTRRMKAIQWSKPVTKSLNSSPPSQPITGIKA
ncbi:MAG: hypothetical protein A4E50_01322 [Methanosaeta sp. PtaB.Bin087]|nr:MAG: hypothetical protein A4E50_01322 [Methanosaeta sp. PtaB.Bin087]